MLASKKVVLNFYFSLGPKFGTQTNTKLQGFHKTQFSMFHGLWLLFCSVTKFMRLQSAQCTVHTEHWPLHSTISVSATKALQQHYSLWWMYEGKGEENDRYWIVVTISLHFSLYIFVKESLKFWPIFVCLTHYQLGLACFVKCTKLQYCKNILSLSSFSCKCLHCSNEYFVSLSQGCFDKCKTWYFRNTNIKWMIKKTFVSRIWQTPPLSVCLPSHCIDLAQTLPHHCYNYCPWPTRMDCWTRGIRGCLDVDNDDVANHCDSKVFGRYQSVLTPCKIETQYRRKVGRWLITPPTPLIQLFL